MKKSEINKMLSIEAKAAANFYNYNTVVKTHTVTMGEQIAIMDEVASGHIKLDGTEQFENYAEMVSCLDENAKIETQNV